MKLVIVCEDSSIEAALRSFFEPIWQVSRQIVVETTKGNGGFLKAMRAQAKRYQAEPQAFVLGLIDVRQAEGVIQFPAKITESSNPTKAKYEHMLAHYESHLPYERCRVLPVVMELETWFIADHEGLNAYFGRPIAGPITAPEAKEQPTEIIKGYFSKQRKSYLKGVHSAAILKKISAQRVYDDHCPHFRPIVDQLRAWQDGSKTAE
jgi:hypothetical protein